ncbi:hypothetical protein ACET3Z_021413 [Daucus carota]
MLGRNMVHDISRDPEKLVAFTYPVEPLGACTGYHLDLNSLSTEAYYILTNMQEVAPYILMFEAEIRNHTPHVLSDSEKDTMMKDNFAKWLQVKAQHNNKQLQYLLGGPASYVISYKRCRVNGPQVLSGRAIDANMEPLQEDVSNTTPIEFSSRSLFVDFSIYEMEDEQEQQNEVESEEDEENEMEAGEDHEEEDDEEEEEEEEDGYDSIEVDSGEEY